MLLNPLHRLLLNLPLPLLPPQLLLLKRLPPPRPLNPLHRPPSLLQLKLLLLPRPLPQSLSLKPLLQNLLLNRLSLPLLPKKPPHPWPFAVAKNLPLRLQPPQQPPLLP